MARKQQGENAEPQSQSQTGGTPENPNADKADGNQSQIQPGTGNNPAGGTYGGESQPSDGGNQAADAGGAPASGGTPSGQ